MMSRVGALENRARRSSIITLMSVRTLRRLALCVRNSTLIFIEKNQDLLNSKRSKNAMSLKGGESGSSDSSSDEDDVDPATNMARSKAQGQMSRFNQE